MAFVRALYSVARRSCCPIAGSGKSVLWYDAHSSSAPCSPISGSAALMEHTRDITAEQLSAGRNVALDYYYLYFNDHDNTQIGGLLGRLLVSFSEQSNSCAIMLRNLHSAHKSERPSQKTLERTLVRMLQNFDRVRIIIDALDEAVD